MKNYTRSGRIRPCRLEKGDLLELIRIVKETFPNSGRKEDFEISTNLPDISIRSNSIEEFLNHKELPDKFNKLSFSIIGWDENRKIDKNVRMTFWSNYINLDVDGFQQTWVLGKYSQISDFLKKKSPWFWSLSKVFPYISGLITSVAFIALVSFINANVMIYSISTGLFLLACIFITISYFKGTFLPYTQIILNRKKSSFSKESIAIIIALLSLIVSIIGGIIIPLLK